VIRRAIALCFAEREGTPEVHGKMDLSKHMRFQSVRLVGAVGIEQNALTFLRDYTRATQLKTIYLRSEQTVCEPRNSYCPLFRPPLSAKVMFSSELHPQGRGLHAHEPMYFNDLTAPGDKFNGDKTTNRIGNGK